MAREPSAPSYELCIVGAGFAGINALQAASHHLERGARVVVLDQRREVGGMWLDTYPYVRLHQPYAFFTFGSVRWSLPRPPEHLATRDEILDHFRRTLADLQSTLDLELRFETRYRGHGADGEHVRVRFEGIDGEHPTEVLARRLIVAIGSDIQARVALPFTSKQVRSISANDIGEITQEGAGPVPVYVLGSGKTGMDCAYQLQRDPVPKRLTLIAGRGMLFRNREYIFPSSFLARVWRGGAVPSDAVYDDFIHPWDGTNTAEVVADLRRRGKLISLVPGAENYQAGLISQAELDVVAEGVGSRIVRGHVEDVVDDEAGVPTMQLRDGTRRPIEAGAYLVNCTGHFVDPPLNQAPILSACGRVLTTAFYLGLSGPSASLLTHAFFAGRLHEVSGRLHANRIGGEPKADVPFRTFLGAMANGFLLADVVPKRFLLSHKANMALWYPAHRRVFPVLRLMWNKQAILDKAERLLR